MDKETAIQKILDSTDWPIAPRNERQKVALIAGLYKMAALGYDAGVAAATKWTPAETPPKEDGWYGVTATSIRCGDVVTVDEYDLRLGWRKPVIAWRELGEPYKPKEVRRETFDDDKDLALAFGAPDDDD